MNQEPSYFNLGISNDQDATMRNYFSRFPEELLVSVMDAFIINQPMTGRSGGDGFWIYQKDDNLFLVLYDCMGHGHLASMMTRVYDQTLEEIIAKKKVEDPGTILRYLHYKIFDKFGEKENLKIGPSADVGVIKINLSIRNIEYSGARTELIHVVDGAVDSLKASRVPVGGYPDQDHNYKTSTVQLKDGKVSNCYLTSDGFRDLMGGDGDGMKLGKRKTLEIFREVYKTPMIQQKDIIEKKITDWKGSQDPLDDLLILGFAI